MHAGWVMSTPLAHCCTCNYMYMYTKFGGNTNVNVLHALSIWYIIKHLFVVLVSAILEFVG